METFSALLAICVGNSPVTDEFPSQRPVTLSFEVFFDLRLKNGWVNNRESGDLRHHRAHYDVIVKGKHSSHVIAFLCRQIRHRSYTEKLRTQVSMYSTYGIQLTLRKWCPSGPYHPMFHRGWAKPKHLEYTKTDKFKLINQMIWVHVMQQREMQYITNIL